MDDLIVVDHVFHLSCPDRSKLVERLRKRAIKDNRLDDASDEVIRRRLETYAAETKPVLDHYGKDLVHEIDATFPPIVVLKNVVDIVTSKTAAK